MSYEAWAIIPNPIDYRLLTIDYWLLNSLNKKAMRNEAWAIIPNHNPVDYWLLTIDS